MTDRLGHGGSAYRATNLIDILDRVLDKGLVVAGDVRISLANVELLTIRIDKAEQIGLNWWRYDQSLVRQPGVDGYEAVIARLEARVAELEQQLALRAPEARPRRGATNRDRVGGA